MAFNSVAKCIRGDPENHWGDVVYVFIHNDQNGQEWLSTEDNFEDDRYLPGFTIDELKGMSHKVIRYQATKFISSLLGQNPFQTVDGQLQFSEHTLS